MPPFEIPQQTLAPVKDTSRESTIDSCFASRIYSEKSSGQTLKKQSSDPVMQNAGDKLKEHIDDSCTLKIDSKVLVE